VNLISIAGKLAEPEHSPIELDGARCVHEFDRLAQCDLCVRACPVDALQLGAHIALDEKKCVACGLCVPTCLVGAFTCDDGFFDLVNLIGRLPENPIVELACPRHPAPQQGVNENANVIRTKTCLAAFGTSRYLQLLIRVPQLFVRTDACAECELGRVRAAITQAAESARSVLAARGEAEQLILITEKPNATAKTRAIYDTKNPPVSRRDLFRVFVAEGSKVAARALDSADESATGNVPPLERRRLINVLRQFVPIEMPEWQSVPASNLGLVRLAADDKCTACGICVRTCPTGAMKFESENNSYRLTVSPAQCTNCGVCIDLCEPKSLRHDGVPTFGQLLGVEPQVLRAGGLKECWRCKQKFADHIEGNLCPICAYRKANPFGSRIPANIAKRN
jgi:energy-converting hydrogenase A subunit P